MRGAFPQLRSSAIWIGLLWAHAQASTVQPFNNLQTDPLYKSGEGTFTWPSGQTAIFDEGSSMTVTWTTSHESVNLYVVYNQTVGKGIQYQTQLATGYQPLSYHWTVECEPDCRAPFSFHAVNAQGTEEEQLIYGFWTRPFWIKPSASKSATSSTPVSSSTLPGSKSSTLAPSASSSAETRPVAKPTASVFASSSESSDDEESDNGTIIGASVGTGVGVLVVVAVAFCLWRQCHRKMKEKYSQPQSGSLQASWPPAPANYQTQSMFSDAKPEITTSPAEAPSWQMDAQELPSRRSP